MTRCTTLDQVVLEKTKLDKVLPRIVRKGDEEGKELAQKVLQNAVVNSKQKNIDGKPSQVQEPKEKDSKNVASNKPPTDNSRISNGLPGIKKPRTVDASAEQPVRKATDAGFLTKSNGQVGKRPQTAKLDPKVVAKSAPVTTPLNPKFKTNHISVKPSGFFSSLQSASKKPGTSNAALLSAKSKEGKDGYVADWILSQSYQRISPFAHHHANILPVLRWKAGLHLLLAPPQQLPRQLNLPFRLPRPWQISTNKKRSNPRNWKKVDHLKLQKRRENGNAS